MSRARHKKAEGGKIEPAITPTLYSGKAGHVDEEAKERKRGGAVEGKMKAMRLDRPGRKLGGRVGSNAAPLSSAATIRDASEHNASEGNADEGP